MNPQDLTQKIAQRLEQWQKAQESQTSGYEYEKSFTELWQQLGQEVFQSSLGEAAYDKNYKKNQKQLGYRDAGEIIVDRNHALAQCPNGFRLSSYLLEITAYLGSDYVFEEGSELLKKLLDVDISAKQLQKVSEYMGSKLEEEAVVGQKEEHKTTQLETSQQVYTYVQMDGSMLLTREENRTADAVERNKARTPFSDSNQRSLC